MRQNRESEFLEAMAGRRHAHALLPGTACAVARHSARLTQIDYEREMALVIVDEYETGAPSTLGVARLVRDPDNIDAEFAVMVRSDLKGQGLGRLLMQSLLDYAALRGTQRIVGHVLRENRAMLGLLKSLGFDGRADRNEPSEMLFVSRQVSSC